MGGINSEKDSRKIRGILQELISNSINSGAKNIESFIKDDGNQIIISVNDDGSGMDKDQLDKASGILNKPRHIEMEEYYGELTGENMRHSGLYMVSILTDHGEIISEPGQGTKVTVYRKK